MASLDEAFVNWSETDPGRTDERKRKKKRSTVLPPEAEVIEPDRPAHRRLPAAELLGGGPTENKEPRSVSVMLNALEGADYFPHPAPEKNDANVYKLEPDWTKIFNDNSVPDWIKERMPQRDAEAPLIPSPRLDGQSTLWQKVPESMRRTPGLDSAEKASTDKLDELQRKLDSMFQKLTDLEGSRGESNHIEIILFILGGLFLLLLLDLLVKQGTQASVYLARAGASSMLGGFRR